MLRYIVFIFLIASCHSNDSSIKKGTEKPALSALQIDSCIQQIERDTNSQSRYAQYLELSKSLLTDTLSQSKINYQLFLADSNELLKYEHLKKVITFEATLKNSDSGRHLLAKTFYKHFYFYYLKNIPHKEIEECEKFIFYSDSSFNGTKRSRLLNMMGIAYEKIGDLKKAREAYLFAFKHANSQLDYNAYISTLSNWINFNITSGTSSDLKRLLDMVESSKEIKDEDKMQLLMVIIEENNGLDELGKINLLKNQINHSTTSLFKLEYLIRIAELYQRNHRYKETLQTYHEANLISEITPRQKAQNMLEMSNCFLQLNKRDSANLYTDMALMKVCKTTKVGDFILPLLDSLTPENTVYDICIAKADQLIAENSKDTMRVKIAVNYLKSAKKVSELIRKQIVFDESKFEWGIDLKRASEKLIHSYYLLFTASKNSSYAKEAFMVAEDSKSTVLQDNTEMAIWANEQADTNYAKFIELCTALNNIEVAEQKATSKGEKDSLKHESDNIISRLSMYKSLSNAVIYKKEIYYSFEELKQYLIRKDMSALSYFSGTDHVYWFYFNPTRNEILFNQRDTILMHSINELCRLQKLEDCYTSKKDRFVQLSNLVYKELIGECLKDNKSSSTLIMADGNLNNLAFDALITNPKNLKSFLIHTSNLSYAYSIRSLIAQEQREENNHNEVFFVAPFANHGKSNLPALTGSKTEADNISKYMNTTIQLDSLATFANFKKSLNDKQYIHIASHATADEIPRIEYYDSSVLVNSIYHIPMNQSLVYLNTCQSGLGKIIYNEGNLSLGRAFYSNGVHNVVMTLWNMNDLSSSTISSNFYKYLNESSNSIEALHNSKLDYLNSHSLDKQAPYYWASLQHVGDGEIKKVQNIWVYIMGVLGVIGLGLMIRKRTRAN